jgi:hypothetical protein
MKKQLLILFVMMFFAGISAFAQIGPAVTNSNPRPIDCEDDALNPIAGKSYDYTALGTPTGGDFQFWATKSSDFISTSGGITTNNSAGRLTAPVDLLATSGNYGIADPAATVSITWSDAILAGTDPLTSPTFVAVQYSGTACADNFRAWSIDPIMAFTVDIKNIENSAGTILAYDAPEEQCMDVVRGATFNAGTINYDFGTQVLYFEVVAANFTNSWTPTFTLTGLGNGQTSLIEYTVTPPPYTAAVWAAEGTTVTTAGATNLGVSIYVRVTITNDTYEGIAPTPITLAVDGQNSIGEWDIVNNDPTQPGVPLCLPTTGADQLDFAVQTLNPRPALTPVAPVPFVPTDVTN